LAGQAIIAGPGRAAWSNSVRGGTDGALDGTVYLVLNGGVKPWLFAGHGALVEPQADHASQTCLSSVVPSLD